MRRLFIIVGLAAGVFLAWKKLTGRQQDEFADERLEPVVTHETEQPATGTA